MIWRSRHRWVFRAGDIYWVLDHVGAVIARHEPSRFKKLGEKYFVDHYVSGDALVERTARGARWARWPETSVLERGLRLDWSETSREFLETLIPRIPEARSVLARIDDAAAKTELGLREVLAGLEHGDDFRRAHEALLDHARTADDLYTRMLRTMVALGHANPSAASLTAFARACLVLCKDEEPPVIDEASERVTSPLAEPVAELAELLDAGEYGEAADAMHTCALLLGHRVAK